MPSAERVIPFRTTPSGAAAPNSSLDSRAPGLLLFLRLTTETCSRRSFAIGEEREGKELDRPILSRTPTELYLCRIGVKGVHKLLFATLLNPAGFSIVVQLI